MELPRTVLDVQPAVLQLRMVLLTALHYMPHVVGLPGTVVEIPVCIVVGAYMALL